MYYNTIFVFWRGVFMKKVILILWAVGFVTWYDAQNGYGQIDRKHSFNFSVILGEKKSVSAGQKVEYEFQNGVVVWVKLL